MATDSLDSLRRELDALGERRMKLEGAEGELAGEVEQALRRAYGKISVAEAARRLKLHRTTIYRVYHPHE